MISADLGLTRQEFSASCGQLDCQMCEASQCEVETIVTNGDESLVETIDEIDALTIEELRRGAIIGRFADKLDNLEGGIHWLESYTIKYEGANCWRVFPSSSDPNQTMHRDRLAQWLFEQSDFGLDEL